MTDDDVQPLNYCAHAIEDLRKHEQACRERKLADDARVYLNLIALLKQSVKFILPNCCDLLDPYTLGQAHLDQLRLPYPCVAFEAPWIKEGGGPEYFGGLLQTDATKRIALCWDLESHPDVAPELAILLSKYGCGVCVAPIYWTPAFGYWTVAIGGTFVPYDSVVQDVDPARMSAPSAIARNAYVEAGQTKANATVFGVHPFVLAPQAFEMAVRKFSSRHEAVAAIFIESHDEVMTAIQACSVINCSNVVTTDVSPAEKLNRKRIANGKQPFFTYKILQLDDEPRTVRPESRGGHHASPRRHLRRGHRRMLASGRAIYVRSAMVNANSRRGFVEKDYAVATAHSVELDSARQAPTTSVPTAS
jgi:hypothetical protein